MKYDKLEELFKWTTVIIIVVVVFGTILLFLMFVGFINFLEIEAFNENAEKFCESRGMDFFPRGNGECVSFSSSESVANKYEIIRDKENNLYLVEVKK